MQVKVVKYRGDVDLEQGLQQMLASGWEVQTQSTRKQAWSQWTGVFTNKQIHTVTFVKK